MPGPPKRKSSYRGHKSSRAKGYTKDRTQEAIQGQSAQNWRAFQHPGNMPSSYARPYSYYTPRRTNWRDWLSEYYPPQSFYPSEYGYRAPGERTAPGMRPGAQPRYATGTIHDPYGQTIPTQRELRPGGGDWYGNKQMRPMMPPAAGYSAYPGEEIATTQEGGGGGGGYGYGGGGYPTRASQSVSRPYPYIPMPQAPVQTQFRPTVEQRGVQPRQVVITRWLHNLTRWMV